MAKRRSQKNGLWGDATAASAEEQLVLNQRAPVIKADGWKFTMARRALYIIAFVGVPLSIVTIFNTAVTSDSSSSSAETLTSISVNDSAGKAPAYVAVTSWLNADPSPLPGGTIVSWAGFETLETETAVGDEPPGYTTEIHHFVLSSGELLFDTSVEVLVDPQRGARVTSTPTLIPVLVSSSWTPQSTWVGYETTQSNENVTETVKAWAEAFTSGRPESLRLVIGDPSSERSYLPLTGASLLNTQIVGSGFLPLEDKDAVPSQIIVRVTLSLAWGDNAQEQKGSSAALITYDLLVTGADTASPRVVSWGGPGSGPALSEYSTAIAASSITVEDFAPADTPESTVNPESSN